MANKYVKVRSTSEKLPDNEIRVRGDAQVGRYLKRAYDLFTQTDNANDTVIIKGMAQAMETVVKLAELIKHRVKGVHQTTSIENVVFVDEYEPKEEGLDTLKFSRNVTMLTIILSKIEPAVKEAGY